MKLAKWILFGLSSTSSIFVGFFLFDSTGASDNFAKLAYWNILACFGGFVFLVLKAYQKDLTTWISERKNGIVVGIGF